MPPNIVLIMADDLGYGDIGCFGNEKIQTPFLDKMATEGLKFTDFHSNGAVCSPTRAALLTGRYQQRSGLEGVIYAKGKTRATGLDVAELTFADYLKSAGYVTGVVGKWHLGYHIDYNPLYHGFDYFRGYVSGNVDYHSHLDGAGIPDWWHDLEKTKENGYVTDLVTKYSVEFIQKNKDKPFFLYVAHEAPHFPFQGRKDKADRKLGAKFEAQGSRKDKQGAY
jgi:arylsulfatase A